MPFLSNLPVRAKLVSAFLACTFLTLVVGGLGLFGMARSDAVTERLYHISMRGVSTVGDLRAQVIDVGRLYRQVLLERSEEATRDNQAKIDANIEHIAKDLEALKSSPLDPEQRVALTELEAVRGDWHDRVDRTLSLAAAGDFDAARTEAKANGTNAATIVAALAKLSTVYGASAKAALDRADAEQRRLQAIVALVIVLAAALALGLGLGLSGAIATPLGEVAAAMDRMAAGDFTRVVKAHSRDEFGQMADAANRAIVGLRTSLGDVREAATHIAQASNELTQSSGSIASGAQEQAASLEETAASLEQITTTVQNNAESSQEASKISRGAREVAEKGGALVGEAVEAMAEIHSASRRISEIITTIDEIAFQTNLLALNAAVEAARAGEQGRGFAVVASEVRGLAQRTTLAAKEIKGLIQDSVNKVETGTALVNRSGATLEEMVRTVKQVSQIVDEIARASGEQSVGIGQVGTAVSQMDQVTQANAAQTEELAGTAEALSHQAASLHTLVARYQLQAAGA